MPSGGVAAGEGDVVIAAENQARENRTQEQTAG